MRTRRDGAGFTIIELLVSILVIGVLIGLLIVVGRIAIRQGYEAATRSTALAMKHAIEQFKQDHGFLPPMIIDEEVPGVTNRASYPVYNLPAGVLNPNRPVFATWRVSLSADPADPSKVREREYLRGWLGGNRLNPDVVGGPADRRFSEFTLGVYLAGMGDVTYGNAEPKAVADGVLGAGSTEPTEDGTWAANADSSRSRTGKTYKAPFSAASGATVWDIDARNSQQAMGRVQIRDRKGRAFRYYRWLRGEPGLNTVNMKLPNGSVNPDWYNVPGLVGDPSSNDELKSADFAIVAAGQNGWFGDMPVEGVNQAALDEMARDVGVAAGSAVDQIRGKAREDNIVEAGR